MVDETQKTRVIIAGGGTGGHVFPALAVGSELIRRDADIMFVGTKNGLESELVPKRGWRIEYLSSLKWKGQTKFKRIKTLVFMPIALIKAIRLILKNRPQVVIGVGGYVSAPILMAATILRIPTLIMEQNSIPGLVNRILGRFAKRICLSFPSSESYFNSKKVLITGNPVREEIREVSPTLPPFRDTFVVMCFGGSQGAKSINEALFASLRFLINRRRGMKIIHQIGFNMDVEMAKDIYQREGFNAEVFHFIDDIADCYTKAHLVICRAGATSIAELMVTGRPTVLIPYPYAADNHQEENAKFVAEGGGAVMVLNGNLSGKKIAEIIERFMHRPERLQEMNEAMKKMARPNAAEVIADECLGLVC